MLSRIKLSSLIAICGGGGLALGGMAMLLTKESNKYANQAGFVKTALNMVEKEPEVVEMIGQPYALGKAQVLDLWTGSLDTNNVKVRVPVKGANDTAFIYAFARKKEKKERLKLFKIEMTFNKVQGKKMILFDVENKGMEHDIEPPPPAEGAKRQPAAAKEVKKASPIPDGIIPERDPAAPRRIPNAILRNRKSSDSPGGKTTETSTSSSRSSSGGDGDQKAAQTSR